VHESTSSRVGSQSSFSIQRPPKTKDSDEGGLNFCDTFPQPAHFVSISDPTRGRNRNYCLEASLTNQKEVDGSTHQDGELLYQLWDGFAPGGARVSMLIHAPSLVLALFTVSCNATCLVVADLLDGGEAMERLYV